MLELTAPELISLALRGMRYEETSREIVELMDNRSISEVLFENYITQVPQRLAQALLLLKPDILEAFTPR